MKDEQMQELLDNHVSTVQRWLRDWGGLNVKPHCNRGICAEYSKRAYSGDGMVYCYLPNPKPRKAKVDYFFICKEPSGMGTRKQTEALRKVEEGGLNFCPDRGAKGLTIFFLSIMNFLDGQPYVTDQSKCAMPVATARSEKPEKKKERYENCFPILEAEKNKYAHPHTVFVNVGFSTDLGTVKRLTADPMEVPHYAIQLNYARHILTLTSSNVEAVKEEMMAGIMKLPSWFLETFYVSDQVTMSLSNGLNGFRVTDSDVLLYLLYKQSFGQRAFRLSESKK